MGSSPSKGTAEDKYKNCSPEEIEEVKKAFAVFDKDKSGMLAMEEVVSILTHPKGRVPFTAQEARAVFRKFDENQDGFLDYSEYFKGHMVMKTAMRAPTAGKATADGAKASKEKMARSKQTIREQRKEIVRQELVQWMEQFDTDQDGRLDRHELKKLLQYVYPDRTPDDDTVDFLMKKATEVNTYSMHLDGHKDGRVLAPAVHDTLAHYHDYLAQQDYIDKAFRLHDKDGSGDFDAAELLSLLRSLCPKAEGLLATGVDFIFAQCDENGNGVIDRAELLATIGNWLAQAKAEVQRLAEEEQGDQGGGGLPGQAFLLAKGPSLKNVGGVVTGILTIPGKVMIKR